MALAVPGRLSPDPQEPKDGLATHVPKPMSPKSDDTPLASSHGLTLGCPSCFTSRCGIP